MDDRFPIQYRAANLPSIPNALWSKSNAIFAICNGAIYRAFDREKGRRITFRFYAKMKEKVKTVEGNQKIKTLISGGRELKIASWRHSIMFHYYSAHFENYNLMI